MTYTVVTSGAYRRALARLPIEVAAAVSELVYGDLCENPQRVGEALLPPFEGQHSARRGDYRIRCRIDADTVTLLAVLARREAYRS